MLLIKGHDRDNPEYAWWFTVGGGKENNENIVDCAVRELFEETGIKINEDKLYAPLIIRDGKFEFTNKTVYQKEYIYLALLHEKVVATNINFTENEKKLIDKVCWWDIDELVEISNKNCKFNIYPRALPGILQRIFDEYPLNLDENMHALGTWHINEFTNEIKYTGINNFIA